MSPGRNPPAKTAPVPERTTTPRESAVGSLHEATRVDRRRERGRRGGGGGGVSGRAEAAERSPGAEWGCWEFVAVEAHPAATVTIAKAMRSRSDRLIACFRCDRGCTGPVAARRPYHGGC